MQKQFLTLIFIAFLFFIKTEKCFSQIEIQNPSFEGQTSTGTPLYWDSCVGSPDTCPTGFLPETSNLSASEGITYCGMLVASLPIQSWESISQKLSCPFKKNQFHEIRIDLAYVEFDYSYWYPGQMGLYGGMNSCDSTELLWLSPELTTYWQTFTVNFIPLENYDFISFWPYVKGYGHVSYVAIDNLSPTITVLNGGLVAAQTSVTEIYIGECAELSAMVSENNYTSVYWSSIPAGFSSIQLNAGTVCPKQNTKYIVHSTDTCGIISTDTVEVKIKKPVIINQYTVHSNSSSENNFTVLGLNAESELSIYNILGQQLFHSSDYKNDFSVTLLSSALYFYQLKTSDGEELKGKFEVF